MHINRGNGVEKENCVANCMFITLLHTNTGNTFGQTNNYTNNIQEKNVLRMNEKKIV